MGFTTKRESLRFEDVGQNQACIKYELSVSSSMRRLTSVCNGEGKFSFLLKKKI